jgi:photosystem II stability/assembly factor-like uncharacterized protein
MPSSDDFVRDALHRRAVDVPTDGVLERVAKRRTRLVWQRRLLGATAVIAVVAIAAGAAAAVHDPNDRVRVGAPTTGIPTTTFATGRTITVPDGPAATFCARASAAASVRGDERELARKTFGDLRVVVCGPGVDGGDDSVLWLRSFVDDGNRWDVVTAVERMGFDPHHAGDVVEAIVADANHGWIVTVSPVIELSKLWRTVDGGDHWSAFSLPVMWPTVTFTSPLEGKVVGKAFAGDPGGTYVTHDGGETWTKAAAPVTTTSTTQPAPTEVPLTRCQTTDVSDTSGVTPAVPAQPTAISISAAADLGLYADQVGRVAVLAPRGWSCAALFGGDGSGVLAVFPPGASYDVYGVTHDGPVVAAFTDGACTGCAAQSLCGAFGVTTTAMGPCPVEAAAGETRTRRDEHTLDFVDPPGVEGVRRPRGAGTTASGAAIWFPNGPTTSWIVTCALGSNVDPRCTPITDDFVARHRTAR